MNKRVLVIPDMHHPFCHVDTVEFLRFIKNKYKPDYVLCLGDEIDANSSSFHPKSSDLHSPNDELAMAIRSLKPLYRLFPKVDVLESNHGSLYYRRAKAGEIPSRVLKSYREVLEAPKGWKWHNDLTLTLPNGTKLYCCHGQSSDVLKNSKNKSMSYIQGHWHSKYELRYWANSDGLYFGVTSGCLIDYKSLAFEYGRLMLDKPILGVTMIIDSLPQLVPMVLKKNGRWRGY